MVLPKMLRKQNLLIYSVYFVKFSVNVLFTSVLCELDRSRHTMALKTNINLPVLSIYPFRCLFLVHIVVENEWHIVLFRQHNDH